MPNWGNWTTDAASGMNWTIYISSIVLLCSLIPVLVGCIIIASVMIIRQYHDMHEWRELDRIEKMKGKIH